MLDHASRPWELDELADQIPYRPRRVAQERQPRRQPTDPYNPLPPPPPVLQYWATGPMANGCRCEQCVAPDSLSFKPANLRLKFSDYDDINPKECKELTQHQYLLCSPLFYAFVLKDRVWGEYNGQS